MWNAVKGFGDVKEHKRGYSPALNSLSHVIKYSKQYRLCAVSLPATSLARNETGFYILGDPEVGQKRGVPVFWPFRIIEQ